VQNIVGCSG